MTPPTPITLPPYAPPYVPIPFKQCVPGQYLDPLGNVCRVLPTGQVIVSKNTKAMYDTLKAKFA